MLSRWSLAQAAVAASLILFPDAACAGLIFDTGVGNNATYRGDGAGPGQGVVVSATTQINGMAMNLAMPNGGQLKYFIFDGANSSLLFDTTLTLAANSTPAWVQSAPFSFLLMAGSTYYFGVMADNALRVNYIFPPVHIAQNGLASVDGSNSNYNNFAQPHYVGPGAANISLRLYGASSVPEPAAALLAGAGMLLLALRRFRRA